MQYTVTAEYADGSPRQVVTVDAPDVQSACDLAAVTRPEGVAVALTAVPA